MRKIPHLRMAKIQRATALVMTLAFVTILTLIVLAYFNVVTTDRQATRNYAQGIQAQEIARGALDFIAGQLRSEMAHGTTPIEAGKYSIFTNIDATNVQPSTVGSEQGVPALLKISTGGLGLYSNADPEALAVSSLSSTRSANDRRISEGRWALPGLGTPTNSPSWFLIGEDGVAAQPSPAVQGRFAFIIYDLGSLIDVNVAGYPSSLNPAQKKELRGTLAGIDLATLPGFDTSSADALIKEFRNRTTASTPSDYLEYVQEGGSKTGFLEAASGDDQFLSRQELLAYADLHNLDDSVRNLTTFSRTSNAPFWSPAEDLGTFNFQTVTRATIDGWNPNSGASTSSPAVSFDYKKDATADASVNRNFLSQAVTETFTRMDGSEAAVGEPLVLERFPLERLQWLSKDGVSAEAIDEFQSESAAAARIKSAFGLVWDASNKLWVYTSPASSNGGGSYTGSGSSDGPASSGKCAKTIKTLAVAAAEKREPDFFELLQAGILRGSLGQRSSIASPTYIQQPGEITPEGHILQIGANIVDQSDTDDYPTLIRAYMPVVMHYDPYNNWQAGAYVIGTGSSALTPHDFAGVENIPYLIGFRTRPYRPQVGDGSVAGRDNLPGRPNAEATLMPQFWNPHQNADTPASERPERFRVIQTFGSIRMAFMNSNNPSVLGYGPGVTSPPSEWPSSTGRPQPSIEFRSDLTFSTPGCLLPANVTATSIPQNIRPALVADGQTVADMESTGFVGFWLGSASGAGNTPFDRTIWNPCGGVGPCPAPYDIAAVAMNVFRNYSPLPASDPFWKGDNVLASSFSERLPVFELQYKDGNVWKTYQRFDGCFRGSGADHTWDMLWSRPFQSFTSEFHARFYSRIDPRGSRFGFVDTINPSAVNSNGEWNGDPKSYYHTLLSNALGTRGRSTGARAPGGITGNQSGAEFATAFDPSSEWSQAPVWQMINNATGGQRYTDNDQVLRRGDADTTDGVNPLDAAGAAYRPLVLNRPFSSVGDLGYVYRDLPFKTLDLFSENSADAGLLDIFAVRQSPPVIAGRVNLNGRNAPVFASALQGAVKTESNGAALTAGEATSIAEAIVAASENEAFTGIWELPKFVASSNFENAANGDLQKTKAQMESVPRTLSGVADTRCWNLLVDIIAQTGRFPPGTTNPDRFVVEGERRYWLQIAIDRATGQIVDQQLEPVYE